MNAPALRSPAEAPPSPLTLGEHAGGVPLTCVWLAHVERRITLALRFGEPGRIVRLDARRRVAVFLPGAMFCRLHWRVDVDGSAKRQLMVMQACASPEGRRRVPGVYPGARVQLIVERPRSLRAVLAQIESIEALGIAPQDAAPLYWLTLGHRLARRLPLPAYTLEQHALWRTGRDAR